LLLLRGFGGRHDDYGGLSSDKTDLRWLFKGDLAGVERRC
jgi:hypothetical protein